VWKIRVTDRAKKQLKKYIKTSDFVHFEKAIHELEQAKDPTGLGTFKNLNDLRCRSYDVTHSLRLLYTVEKELNMITIHRLGDHKAVYGRD
jgi:addiction module RelE/StbE family toxin